MAHTQSKMHGASLRSLAKKAAPILCCLAGLLYPLAGFIIFAVLRVRGGDPALRNAALIGAVVSLAVYVLSFTTGVVLGG